MSEQQQQVCTTDSSGQQQGGEAAPLYASYGVSSQDLSITPTPSSPTSSSHHHHRHHSHHRSRSSSRNKDDSKNGGEYDKESSHGRHDHHRHHHHRHHDGHSRSRTSRRSSHRRRSSSRSGSSNSRSRSPRQDPSSSAQRKRSGWDQPANSASTTTTDTSASASSAGVASASSSAASTASTSLQYVYPTNSTSTSAVNYDDPLRRRIYLGGFPYDTTELQLRTVFSAFGPVTGIDLVRETNTGRLKGYGFLDFATEEATNAVLSITAPLMIGGRPIKIGRPHQNQPPSATPGLSFGPSVVGNSMNAMNESAIAAANASAALAVSQDQADFRRSCRIFVGNIVFEVVESQVREVFSSFGKILSCSLVPNPDTGKHRGYGFIEFDNPQSAEMAMTRMNGFVFCGRPLRVGPAAPNAMITPTVTQQQSVAQQIQLQPPVIAPPVNASGETSISNEENMTITPSQRILLMQNLARDKPIGGGSQLKSEEPVGATGASGIVVAVPPVIVLRNLLPPQVPCDPDLADEVRDECSKYGTVANVVTHTDDANTVEVFVRFSALSDAENAVRCFQGRCFDGRQISASLVSDLTLIARLSI